MTRRARSVLALIAAPAAALALAGGAAAKSFTLPQANVTVRGYLTDFPRLHEAPPATLQLWERFLVYGIAFGIADRVLQAAHMSMPEEVAQASSIYWISPGGNLGAGATSIAIGDLASGFGSALAPPSSGAGGGGVGFSGGGGGGGGGAW